MTTNNEQPAASDLSESAGSVARCDNCKHSHEEEERYDQRWCSMWCENVECSEVCRDHEFHSQNTKDNHE